MNKTGSDTFLQSNSSVTLLMHLNGTVTLFVTGRVLLAGPRRPLACGLRAGALGPSCTAQLVFVSFVVAICEVGTAPGRPTASSSAAVAPTVSFERRRLSCWLVASIWHAE